MGILPHRLDFHDGDGPSSEGTSDSSSGNAFDGMGAELLFVSSRGHRGGKGGTGGHHAPADSGHHGHVSHGGGHERPAKHKHEVASTPPQPPSEPPPTLQQMIAQSMDLNRMAYANPFASDFNIQRTDEAGFKSRYVQESLRIGHQVGLDSTITKDVLRRIYSFEVGGWGTADTLSGMREHMIAPEAANEREQFVPVSSAMGYNQVIRPTTLFLIHQSGDAIADRLREMARKESDPTRSIELTQKADLLVDLRSTIDKSAESIPQQPEFHDEKGKPTWQLYQKLAATDTPVVLSYTGRQLSNAVHALNLDKDIGPLIQAENLHTLMDFCQSNNIRGMLNQRVAEIKKRAQEYDKQPDDKKEKAVEEVSQFMRKTAGVPAIPLNLDQLGQVLVAERVEARLRALQPGNDYSLAHGKLPAEEHRMVMSIIAHAGGLDRIDTKFSPEARGLVSKMIDSHYRGSSGDALLPAAMELGNLVGTGRALQMLRPESAGKPASNFFSKAGYRANPVAHHKTASQLLMTIYKQMSRADGYDPKPGLNQLMFYLDNAAEH